MKILVRRSVPLVNKRMSLILMIEDWAYLNGHDYRKRFGFDFRHFFDRQYPNTSIPNQHRVHQKILGFGQTLIDLNCEFGLRLSSNSF